MKAGASSLHSSYHCSPGEWAGDLERTFIDLAGDEALGARVRLERRWRKADFLREC